MVQGLEGPRSSDSPRARRTSSSSSTIRCNRCGSTFARHEHLTRHIRTHTRERPFKCNICGKSFSRQDVLTRHYASHDEIPGEALVDGVSGRACRACAASRVRCSKGHPCRRCMQRDVECVYASGKNRDVGVPPHADGSGAGLDGAGSRSGGNSAPRIIGSGVQQETSTGTAPSLSPMTGGNSWMERTNAIVTADSIPLHAAAESLVIENFYGYPPGVNDYADQAAGMLSVNWMSPESQNDMNWDDQVAALNYGNMNFWGSFGLQVPPADAIEVSPDVFQDRTQGPEPDVPGSEVDERPLLAEAVSLDDQDGGSAPSAVGSAASARTQGRFYVDGDAARAPFRGLSHQRGTVISPGAVLDTTSPATASCSDTNLPRDNGDMPTSRRDLVSEEAYQSFCRSVQKPLQRHGQSFQDHAMACSYDTHIPSLQHARLLSRIYFERFHPIYPFLRQHHSLFEGETGWIILVAVISVGAKYAQATSPLPSADRLFDLLQAVLSDHLQSSSNGEDTPWMPRSFNHSIATSSDLAVVQAAILNQICLLHSGSDKLVKQASLQRFRLVDACHNMQLLTTYDNSAELPRSGSAHWLELQSRIKTGMMIWILDCICEFQFGFRCLMTLSDLTVPLPCLEDIGDNNSSNADLNLQTCTVLQALEMMYMEKRLPPNLSEFGTMLLVIAIYRKNKEVIREQQTELAAWVPHAKIQARTPHFDRGVDETWPPASSLLSKWRNSACDSLDILHWSANSKVARAGGWEHATILLLHLSRLVILAPTDYMQDLAVLSLQKASSSNQPASATRTAKYVKARNHLLQWAVRDQFKARLAIIHAGALFWHARRYSNNSFLEPFAIYIATLVAWAYSVSTQFIGSSKSGNLPSAPQEASIIPSGPAINAANSNNQEAGSGGPVEQQHGLAADESESEPEPSFIHLDRPCDDELVQIYVRLGHKMPGYISGVGNICAPGAPAKILREGVRLLLGESGHRRHGAWGQTRPTSPPQLMSGSPYTWGIEPSYTRMLQSLIPETPAAPDPASLRGTRESHHQT